MIRIAPTIMSLLILLTLCPAQSITVPGHIRMLPGCVHQRGLGFDTTVGRISCQSGLEMNYDIGELAGVYANCKNCGWIDGEVWRRKQIIAGHPAVIVFTKAKRLVVSFPESHANFYATVRSEADLADVLLMACTYNP